MSIKAYELGTPIMQLTQEKWVAFSRLIYQGTKSVMGTRTLMLTIPVAYNLTMSQPCYSINITA